MEYHVYFYVSFAVKNQPAVPLFPMVFKNVNIVFFSFKSFLWIVIFCCLNGMYTKYMAFVPVHSLYTCFKYLYCNYPVSTGILKKFSALKNIYLEYIAFYYYYHLYQTVYYYENEMKYYLD